MTDHQPPPPPPPAPKRGGRAKWWILGIVGGLLALLVVVVVAVVLLAPDEADIPAIEKEISKGVEEQSGAAVEVDCPDTVEWETGSDFRCEVEAEDGTTLEATVTMDNDDGDITWSVE